MSKKPKYTTGPDGRLNPPDNCPRMGAEEFDCVEPWPCKRQSSCEYFLSIPGNRACLTIVSGCCSRPVGNFSRRAPERDIARADVVACRFCGKMVKNRYGELSVLDLEGGW